MHEIEIAEEALIEFEKTCRRAGMDSDDLVSALDQLIEQADARRRELASSYHDNDEDYQN